MTISSVTLARKIQLPEDGLRTETCQKFFNVLMCKKKIYKFYICAVVGVIIEYLDNIHGITMKILTANFLLLLLCLGCKTNQRNIPFGCLIQLLVQGHQGPFLCFLDCFQFLLQMLKDLALV